MVLSPFDWTMLEASPLQRIDVEALKATLASLHVDKATPNGSSLQATAQAIFDSDGFEIERVNEILYEIAMSRAEGNVARAAQLLGLTRPQLAYRLQQLQNRSSLPIARHTDTEKSSP